MELKFLKKLDEKEWLNELAVWLAVSLLMAFILSINIKWPVVSIEPLNLLVMFLLSLLMFLVFIGAQKTMAFFLDCETRTRLITFRRFWFRAHDVFSFDFPAWLLFPLIILFATSSYIRWLAVLSFDIEPKLTRVRRRWAELTEFDIAKVAIAGPAAVLILGLIARIIGFNDFAMLCVLLALLSLIPIGLGFKMLMSSRLLWIFSFLFTLSIFLIMHVAGAFVTIVMAVLIAAILTLAYYILYEK